MLFHPAADLAHVPSIVPLTVLVDQVCDFLHVGKCPAADGLSISLGNYKQIGQEGNNTRRRYQLRAFLLIRRNISPRFGLDCGHVIFGLSCSPFEA